MISKLRILIPVILLMVLVSACTTTATLTNTPTPTERPQLSLLQHRLGHRYLLSPQLPML